MLRLNTPAEVAKAPKQAAQRFAFSVISVDLGLVEYLAPVRHL
ncbi:hypothetical protein QCE63_17220 [Caballeronia sp. LZ065]|jgi:hypothetical protein|nr:hypothetical protein [Caballeronia sp. LZ065]MDR5781165.1 hypothetical protein [Caballeronia sp. LZ065]